MKYIDAEKLIAGIKHLQEKFPVATYEALEHLITSLQQEQPMPDSTKLIELWNEDKEMLKEKDFRDDVWRLAYNAFLCGFGRGIAVKKQEQQKVDLDKEIDKQIRSTFYDLDGIAIIGTSEYASVEDMEYIARHFYELGQRTKYQQDREEFAKLKAKEWQEGYDEGYAKGLNARKK